MTKQLKPNEILDANIESGVVKANSSFMKLLLLSIMAGMFIAFGGEASNMATFGLIANPATFGLGKCLAGAMFGAGLMMVVLCGGELFTGNCLIFTAVLDKRTTIPKMLRNWVIVYIGNFIGSIFIAYCVYQSGMFNSGADLLGAMTLKIAVGKCNLSFMRALIMGILCNILVCLGVWISTGADSTIGKIFGIFFTIWLFVVSGFEHSVANMYYVPAGLFAKGTASFVELSGVSAEALANLTWSSFAINNLVPVTIGNILGGAIFVGAIYYAAYKKA